MIRSATPVPSSPSSVNSAVTTLGPALDIVEPATEPAPAPAQLLDSVVELRHPKAVPALHLSDARWVRPIVIARSPARAALVVIAAAALAMVATHIGSCAARVGHAQAVAPASRPAGAGGARVAGGQADAAAGGAGADRDGDATAGSS